MARPKKDITIRGVSFQDQELDYLDSVLSTETGLNRSAIVNALIKQQRLRGEDPEELVRVLHLVKEPIETTS